MKKITIILGIIFVQLSLFAQIPTDSLVLYLPFNGNAIDESGNGNDGTVNGATLTEDRFGNPNSAYQFDGIDDYIFFETNLFNNNIGSISVWVYLNNIDERMPIFSQGMPSALSNSLRLTIWQDSLTAIIDHRQCASSTDYPTIRAFSQINMSEWIHIVITSNGTQHKMYINNIEYNYYECNNNVAGEWLGDLCSGSK